MQDCVIVITIVVVLPKTYVLMEWDIVPIIAKTGAPQNILVVKESAIATPPSSVSASTVVRKKN